MKKSFVLGILLALLIATPVSSYVVKKGDTPYGIWGKNWKTELLSYGISDPKQLPVGLSIEDKKLGGSATVSSKINAMPEDNYDTFITSPFSSSATEVFVNKVPNVSTTIYTIYASDGTTPNEKVYCTGWSISPNKLTGCLRGLSFYPINGRVDLVTSTGISHSRNSRIAITDNIHFTGKAMAIFNGDQETGGTTFTVSTNTTSGIRLSATDKAIYSWDNTVTSPFLKYNGTNWQFSDDGVNTTNMVTGGSGLAPSSTKGIEVVDSKIGINASSTTGGAFDSTGKYYQAIGNALTYTGNAIAVSTSTIVSQIATSTPTAGAIPMATVSGTIPVTWMATSTISGQILRSTSTGSFWDDIGSSVVTTTGHSLGVIYTNNSTRTKLVIVSVTFNISGGGDQNLTSVASIHSSSLATTTVASIGARANNVSTNSFTITPSMTFIVPRGFDYTVVGGSSLVSWSEMEL